VSEAAAPGPLRLGLLGNPNSGKTTLFNALTGLRARVGNYPGVTVERREADIDLDGRRAVVIDLPGTYSLEPLSEDEAIVSRVLAGDVAEVPPPDALVVVADACSLERSLAFVGDIVRRGLPTCLVLTMLDELHARGGRLDRERLEAALGIPVIEVIGHRGIGIDRLRALLPAPETWSTPPLPPPAERDERARWADSVLSHVLSTRPGRHRLTDAIDRVVLHPMLGVALFVVVMTCFFQLIFAWASPLMDAIDGGVAVLGEAARAGLPPGLLADFVVDGVIAGVGSVVIFLPQIVLLFALLHLLEDVGYMARAAFVVDRVMGWVGLEGRAFVALLSSYACAVPGIMATRTISDRRDRLLTILVAPLMSCSARLPVYAILIAAFVPPALVLGFVPLRGVVLGLLYLLGIVVAVIAAIVIRKTLVRGPTADFVMELPPYRVPSLRNVGLRVYDRSKDFAWKAGTIIFAMSIVVWALGYFPRSSEVLDRYESKREELAANLEGDELEEARSRLDNEERGALLRASALGRMGRAIEPVVRPLGWDWRIGMAVLAAFPAREVVVSTLGIVYDLGEEGAEQEERLVTRIRNTKWPDGSRIFTVPVALSLMVFFALCCQCGATVATIRRETNSWRWAIFAFTYLTVLAYVAALLTYQVGTALA